MRKTWTPEQERILIELFPTTKNRALAIMLGKSIDSVSAYAHRRGLRKVGEVAHRKHHFNEHYFDFLTPESAYWLGFIQADGTVWRDEALSISVRAADAEHLATFLVDIGADRSMMKHHVSNFGTDYVRVQIYSAHLVRQLMDIGVLPNKTGLGTFPTLPLSDLSRHYIRGIFDGDGSVRKDGGSVEILGSMGFCHYLAELLRDLVGITNVLIRDYGNFARIEIGHRPEVWRFYLWLYQDATRWLERKRCRFEESFRPLITRRGLIPTIRASAPLRAELSSIQSQTLGNADALIVDTGGGEPALVVMRIETFKAYLGKEDVK